ncbi:unnamed protein product [Arabidopsis arenosa]|uniref:ABC transporter domain-containing protein n=1 Tax=Arabidopsis arenosa TaxID=38785 RepID=A0A8S1ZDS0_ARAAE|nr:unnamed protein product [Arabidopsis arenosa]
MEGTSFQKASNSLRRNSSVWRKDSGMEIFSRKGILTASHAGGAINEIDIQKLGFQDTKKLLERLIKVGDDEHEKLLWKLKKRIDRVGIDLPTIEVRFDHLKVEAEVHVGGRALPSFVNFISNFGDKFLNTLHLVPNRKKKFTILNDVSGIVKPGRMALLLGPPSSGKTTLLLALAGKLDLELKQTGRVTYNGHGMNEFVPQRTAAYIGQNDVHIGEMTVRETFAYAARFQGVGSRYDMLTELARREKEANIKPDADVDVFMKAMSTAGEKTNVMTDYILKILGLEVCADTMVGDDMLRGISGGQKKRVTTGEMLVGPSRALFMDEISTGLDSSTTYQIVNSLRNYVHIFNGTALISLLQPAPETFNLFDDIILIAEGEIIYEGPRDHVVEFFETMGFKCPPRKGVADFLQEVTSKKDQMQYWARRDEPYRFIRVREFAEAFQSFHVGRRIGDELALPFDKTKSHPAALTTKKYGVGIKELVKTSFSREYLLMKRNSFVYYFKFGQLLVMAFLTMTLFFRTEMQKKTVVDGNLYTGALFFLLMMLMFNGMSELSMTIAKLPVFYKQRDLLFYPAWVYSLPPWLLKIPISFIESALTTFITYYVIGFDPNVGRLFKQYILLVLMNQMASALFKMVAALGRNMIVANTFGAFAMLVFFALGGVVLSRDDIKKWWIWGYWISPIMYGQNAILANEFFGHSWSRAVPNSSETLGVTFLKSRGFLPHAYWYWIGTGALLGFVVLFNFGFTLALTFLNSLGKPQAVIAEEPASDETELQSARTEGVVEAGANKKRGMVLPFEPHSITFDNVVYSVDMPQEMIEQGTQEDKLVLLKGVNGAFRPGVLTALMGVSGAGKTTLMDVLAGRKTGGYIDGNITISGYPKNQQTFARISGYCEQTDIHSPHVTVYESLVYSAWLRLPKEVDSNKRKIFIEEVMELVELTPLRQALVGLPGESGLSTEQRKRLTIAVELVANPSIIFMDEPTSGLDARAAAIVMRTVRNTVDTGRTVVCTIHQPSIDIFEAFDELFLLKRGGEEIYVGPLGHESTHLINYFESIQGISKITEGTLQEKQGAYQGAKPASPRIKRSVFPNTILTVVLDTIFLFTIGIALMFGTMFWDLGGKTKTTQDLSNAMGSMYTAVLFLGLQNAASVQPVVNVERTVFYREQAAGMYSAMPYAFAQVFIEIPYVFVQAVVYGLIVYAMIGFEWTAVKFFWYLFFMYGSFLTFTFYGMMAVAMTPNHHIASVVSSAFYGIWNLFSGFLIPRPSMPVWWEWYYWLCPIAWTLYGLIASQFGDITEPMADGTSVKQFIRDFYGYREGFLGVVAAMNVIFPLLFAVIFAVGIKSFNFQKR